MNVAPRPENEALPLLLARQVEAAYQGFESAWRAGRRPAIEDHIGSLPEPARAALLPELLEVLLRAHGLARAATAGQFQLQEFGEEHGPRRLRQAAEVVLDQGPLA